MVRAVAILSLLLGIGCRGSDGPPAQPDASAPQPDASGYPAPRTDLVPKLGSDDALDIATWNVENFPRTPQTASTMADLIASMELDIVAMQEVQSVDAWNELVARLPDHEGVLSTHTYGNGEYQKVGILYRADLIEAGPPVLVFDLDGYEFPRPVLQVPLTASDGVHPPLTFIVMALHLKAGFSEEDRSRREVAIQMLEAHVRTTTSAGSDVMVMGDFNEVITTTGGMARFAPFLSAPDQYDFHTDTLAADGAASFVPSGAILDHIITTPGLADELAGGQDQIPRLDAELSTYLSSVSDHLPVVISMPLWD